MHNLWSIHVLQLSLQGRVAEEGEALMPQNACAASTTSCWAAGNCICSYNGGNHGSDPFIVLQSRMGLTRTASLRSVHSSKLLDWQNANMADIALPCNCKNAACLGGTLATLAE